MEQEQLLSQLEDILDAEPTADELLAFLEGLFSYLGSEYDTIYVDSAAHNKYESLVLELTQKLCAAGDPDAVPVKVRLLDAVHNALCPDYTAGEALDRQLRDMMDLLTLHQMYTERAPGEFEAKLRDHLQTFLDTVDREYQTAYEKKRKFDAGKLKLYLQRAETAESALAAAKANVEMTRASLKAAQAENERLRLELATLKKELA